MVQLSQHRSDPSLIYYKFSDDISADDIEFIYKMNTVFIKKYKQISIFININETPIIDLNIVPMAAKNANARNGAIKKTVIFNLLGFNLVFAYNLLNMLKADIRKKYQLFSTKQECEVESKLIFEQDFKVFSKVTVK